jgi:hypothetical protein
MNKQEIKFLEELLSNDSRLEKVPKGYFTVEQIAEGLKISVSNARRRIRYATANEPAKIKCMDLSIRAGSRILKVRHYKFTKK